MAKGHHPQLINGALIGALVAMLPAVGSPTLTLPDEVDGEIIEVESPNPDYRSSEQATLSAITLACNKAGIAVFDAFFSGDTPPGQGRVALQIEVASHEGSEETRAMLQNEEADRRSVLDRVLADFAPA